MRSELTVCSTIVSMAFLMSLLAGYANSRAVLEEVKIDDYGWEPVLIPDDAKHGSIIDVGCRYKLPSESVGHTFRLNLNTNKDVRSCIIELPPSTNIELLSLNFHAPRTFARILTGNVHNRPNVFSSIIRKTPPSHQGYGVYCAYGYLVVRFESPEDTVLFKLHHMEFDIEDPMYVTEDQCRPPED